MIDIEKIKQAALDVKAGRWNSSNYAITTNQALELINRLEAAEQDAARWIWMLERMSGKDVMIFAQRPAGRDDYCDDIIADIDAAMEEMK